MFIKRCLLSDVFHVSHGLICFQALLFAYVGLIPQIVENINVSTVVSYEFIDLFINFRVFLFCACLFLVSTDIFIFTSLSIKPTFAVYLNSTCFISSKRSLPAVICIYLSFSNFRQSSCLRCIFQVSLFSLRL